MNPPLCRMTVCTSPPQFLHYEWLTFALVAPLGLKVPPPAPVTSTVPLKDYMSHQYLGGGKGLFGMNIGPGGPPPLGAGRLPLRIGSGPRWNRANG